MKEQQYRIHEMFQFQDGNDDILSDIGNTGEARHSMWALMPYGVNDGPGVVNENFISFVLNRNKYPTRELPSAPYLLDKFNECVSNLKETLNHVQDKKKFYNNLLELQNYLIRGKFYDREPLEEHVMSLSEGVADLTDPISEEYGIKIANELAKKLNLGQPQYLGGGEFGRAFLINGNKVLKLTSDSGEVDAAAKIQRGEPKVLANVYNIYKIYDSESDRGMYALIEEYVPEKPTKEFDRLTDLLAGIETEAYGGDLYGALIGLLAKGKSISFPGKSFDDFPEMATIITNGKSGTNISNADREKAYNFMMGLYEIKKELNSLNIKSRDFFEARNLGYMNGVLTMFDVGGYKAPELEVQPNNMVTLPEGEQNQDIEKRKDRLEYAFEKILGINLNKTLSSYLKTGRFDFDKEKIKRYFSKNPIDFKTFKSLVSNTKSIDEDSTSLYSTDNSIGSDDFPVYDKNDSSPLTDNNVPVNTEMYEDFNYEHASDATQDEYVINERIKSSMPNSSSVEVKKKCRLAGNGNTSTACNQGDINNLNLKPISELFEDYTNEILETLKKKLNCHPISLTREIILYLKNFKSDEDLLRSGGLPTNLLDDAAFGFNSDTLKQISPKQLSIKWKDDYVNVLYEVQKSGLSKYAWARKINLSEPIDVSFDGKEFYIEDGHHRYFAAKTLGQPLNINLEIKANPITKLGGDLGYDDFHRCIWKQVNNQNSSVENSLDENKQQMEKAYVKTGIYDSDDVDTILNITGGDAWTKLIADMYYYFGNRFNKDKNEHKKLRQTELNALIEAHELLLRYNKNTLPIHDLFAQEHNAHPGEKWQDLRTREAIISRLRNFPSVMLRNLGNDIRKERQHWEFETLFQQIKEIQAALELLEKVKPEKKEIIYKKIFSSNNDSFAAIQKRLEDTTLPYLSQDEELPDMEGKVSDMGDEAEILYSQNNILVVAIKSSEAMKYLGCSSQWCFAVEGGDEYWNDYAEENRFPIIVYNFNEEPSEPLRMVVVLPNSEVYTMYNEQMDGSYYLSELGISDIVSKYQPEYEEELNENVGEENYDSEYPIITVDEISGLIIRDDIPNMSSIGASLNDYEILNGIRELSFSKDFPEYPIKPRQYSVEQDERVKKLMQQIEYNKEISPLIVVIDNEGAYVLEGSHRFDALRLLGIDKFPAKVVIDNESLNSVKSIDENVMNEVQLMSLQDLPFKQEVEKLGGKIFSVGGAVRDEFLGKESKDLDILITGIPMDKLEEILSHYGRVDAVGKSFGILKFKPQGSTEDIDVAIPRTEKPTGSGGHKGFEVSSDHALPIEDDLRRRDFTINAIAKDINGNIIDPFGGQQDLQNKIIRVVNPEAFSDDPLRMLRAIQFASRFGFTIEPETMKLIIDNASRIKEIPPERILIEFQKIVDKGDKLIGVDLLRKSGLFQQIFGRDIGINRADPWNQVKTMGEYIYLMIKDIIENPSEFYLKNLKGDIDSNKEIKALDLAFKNNSSNPIAARSIAHNMYSISPQSLQSQMLPTGVKVAAQELLSAKYPKMISDLAVNGNDLMALGLKGKEIGDTLKMMLLKVYSDNARNNKDELLKLINSEL